MNHAWSATLFISSTTGIRSVRSLFCVHSKRKQPPVTIHISGREAAKSVADLTESSGWTVDTLLAYWKDRHLDLQLQMEQRFDAQSRAIEAAITAQRNAIDAALVAADRATNKAETATELRFQSVNEFRQTLSDQASTFITRNEAEGMVTRNTERISEVANRLQDFALRNIVMAEYDRLSTQVQGIAERLTRIEGRGSGLQAGWGYVGAIVAIVASIIATYFVLKGG